MSDQNDNNNKSDTAKQPPSQPQPQPQPSVQPQAAQPQPAPEQPPQPAQPQPPSQAPSQPPQTQQQPPQVLRAAAADEKDKPAIVETAPKTASETVSTLAKRLESEGYSALGKLIVAENRPALGEWLIHTLSSSPTTKQLLEFANGLAEKVKAHENAYKEEYLFFVDKRILRRSGVFVAASEKLLTTHSEMAMASWKHDCQINNMKKDWKTKLDSKSTRPTELAKSIVNVLPVEFDIPADPKNHPQPAKSAASGSVIWKLTNTDLARITAQPQWSNMDRMRSTVEGFANDKHNPFVSTAQTALPLISPVVALLQTCANPELDKKCFDMLDMAIIGPANDLLSSPLQAAFKDGRDAYSKLTSKVEHNKKELEIARQSDDLKTIVALEEAQIRATEDALVANHKLRELIDDPKHAELFLNGESGKLATSRKQMRESFEAEKRIWSEIQDHYRTDFSTLGTLRDRVNQQLDADKHEATCDRQTAKLQSESYAEWIQDMGSVWDYFSARRSKCEQYFHEIVKMTEEDIKLEATVEAKKTINANLDRYQEKLVSFGACANGAQTLLDYVQKVVDLGVNGVESELRSRLQTLNSDKSVLEADLRDLFTTRYGLVADRRNKFKIRLQNLELKLKDLRQQMERAEAGMEIELHAELAEKVRAQQMLKTTTNEELEAIHAELNAMDGDKLVESIFAKVNNVDHPRVAANSAQMRLVRQNQVSECLEDTILKLRAIGIDSHLLMSHLQNLTALHSPISKINTLALAAVKSAAQSAASAAADEKTIAIPQPLIVIPQPLRPGSVQSDDLITILEASPFEFEKISKPNTPNALTTTTAAGH